MKKQEAIRTAQRYQLVSEWYGWLINGTNLVEKYNCRAGGNGTAGTAMAVPAFEGEKWRRLDSNLACVIECPLRALRRSLGRLRGL